MCIIPFNTSEQQKGKSTCNLAVTTKSRLDKPGMRSDVALVVIKFTVVVYIYRYSKRRIDCKYIRSHSQQTRQDPEIDRIQRSLSVMNLVGLDWSNVSTFRKYQKLRRVETWPSGTPLAEMIIDPLTLYKSISQQGFVFFRPCENPACKRCGMAGIFRRLVLT